ncbi:MAG: NfeD family protein [Methanocorpusculum sp.]|jgi:membrane protein implicated in regulation of membrane protease activity|uniref:NfeD family protein n=1 Tax=Methanocorpusculum sp. TaxID=2058474 RepID=UPI00271F4C9A|nr:NfeD family protein [Methanocorpusculum sp.]MDO9522761.1 NfeD family protein [Methanocorpusculum sp.]
MFELLLSPTVLPWVLIAIGAALLLIEASSPGFFMAVPGTAMIFLGVMDFFFGLEFLSSPLGITLTVLAAILAAVVTVFLYKKLSPDQKPTTSGQDSIIGKPGYVTVEIVPDSISGKVEIDGVVWSAKCTDGTIPPGTKIEVTAASGVHLTVKKV